MIQIAITDDTRVIRQSLTEKLTASGAVAISFVTANGKEFLEKMRALAPAERPAVVLMDIAMPELNGIDTVCIAKELYPQVNFIMLTVFDEDDKIFEAIKAGASGYLLKEESIERIVEAIIDVENGAPMSPKIARKALKFLQDGPAPVPKETHIEHHILSVREMEILGHTVDGLNYQQIGELLFISPLTVKKHIRNIYEKLHVNSKLSAVKVAMKKGWFSR